MNKNFCIYCFVIASIFSCLNAYAGYSAPVQRDATLNNPGYRNDNVKPKCLYCHNEIGDNFGKQCSERKTGLSCAPVLDSRERYVVNGKCSYCGEFTNFSLGERCKERLDGFSHAPCEDPKGYYKEEKNSIQKIGSNLYLENPNSGLIEGSKDDNDSIKKGTEISDIAKKISHYAQKLSKSANELEQALERISK